MASLEIRINTKFTGRGGFAKLNKDTGKLQINLERVSASLKQIGVELLKVGAAFSVAFGAPVVVAATFEKTISGVRALLTGSAESAEELEVSIKRLTKEALRLGETTQFTANQAGEAIQFLAKAGFDADEIMKSLNATLNLAAVENIDLATSADIASNILTGFARKAEDLNTIVDTLANVSTNSNTNLIELGEALKSAAPIANSAGISINETVAAIGSLANAGLKGTVAGTSLRAIIRSLIAPSAEAKTVLENLGIQVIDNQGDFIGLSSVLEQFELRTVQLGGKAEKTAKLLEIFGQRGGPGFAALLGQGSKALVTLTNTAGRVGTAAEIARIQLDNLSGSVTLLLSALEGFLIKVGTPFLAFLTGVVKGITFVVGAINRAFESLGSFGTAAVAVVGSIGVLALALGGLALTLGAIGSAIVVATKLFATLTLVVPALAVSLKVLSLAFGTVALSIGVFIAAFTLASVLRETILDVEIFGLTFDEIFQRIAIAAFKSSVRVKEVLNSLISTFKELFGQDITAETNVALALEEERRLLDEVGKGIKRDIAERIKLRDELIAETAARKLANEETKKELSLGIKAREEFIRNTAARKVQGVLSDTSLDEQQQADKIQKITEQLFAKLDLIDKERVKNKEKLALIELAEKRRLLQIEQQIEFDIQQETIAQLKLNQNKSLADLNKFFNEREILIRSQAENEINAFVEDVTLTSDELAASAQLVTNRLFIDLDKLNDERLVAEDIFKQKRLEVANILKESELSALDEINKLQLFNLEKTQQIRRKQLESLPSITEAQLKKLSEIELKETDKLLNTQNEKRIENEKDIQDFIIREQTQGIQDRFKREKAEFEIQQQDRRDQLDELLDKDKTITEETKDLRLQALDEILLKEEKVFEKRQENEIKIQDLQKGVALQQVQVGLAEENDFRLSADQERNELELLQFQLQNERKLQALADFGVKADELAVLRTQFEKQQGDLRVQLEAETNTKRLELTQGLFGGLSQLGQTFVEFSKGQSKELFAVSQGLAIAEATLNVAKAFSTTIGQGGFFSVGQAVIAASFATAQLVKIIGTTLGFNEGGFVPGPASAANVDSVNARLTPGEVVIDRPTVQDFGRGFFGGMLSGAIKPKDIGNISTRTTVPVKRSGGFQTGGTPALSTTPSAAGEGGGMSVTIQNIVDREEIIQVVNSEPTRNVIKNFMRNDPEFREIILNGR